MGLEGRGTEGRDVALQRGGGRSERDYASLGASFFRKSRTEAREKGTAEGPSTTSLWRPRCVGRGDSKLMDLWFPVPQGTQSYGHQRGREGEP